jgi:hypothetical protein
MLISRNNSNFFFPQLSSLFLPLRQVAPPSQKLVDERPLIGSLIACRRSTSSSTPAASASSSKTALGRLCPVCDHPLHKQHSRDHVAWHFMDELKSLIDDPTQCPDCNYTGDKLESVARHLALFHQKLDQFLADEALVAEKRSKALSKPKKVRVKGYFPCFHLNFLEFFFIVMYFFYDLRWLWRNCARASLSPNLDFNLS